jgi:TPR repeat protein
MLFKGNFYNRDEVAAMLWLERAAKSGHAEARKELAKRRP